MANHLMAAAVLLMVAGMTGAGAEDIQRVRSPSSCHLPPAGPPISPAGSSPTFSAVISARNLWSRRRRRRRHHWSAPRRAGDSRRLHDFFRPYGHQCLAAAFYPNLGYDPQKDFEPIGLTAEYPDCLWSAKIFPPTISGIRRLRQSQCGQAQCRARRAWLGVLYRLSSAQLGDRHQADPGPVYRHRAGAERDAGGRDRL